ncbi:MAG: hypothetical protein FWD28_03050 [Treponema sp.]|nr:hypothetical protein [Treponema sp.]
MRKKIEKLLLISVVTIIILFSAGCSRSEPEIVFGFLKLVIYNEEDGLRERFSFFIMPDDEDGIENLDEIYLFHDIEQLRWHIKSDEWIHTVHDGKDWIGTRSIAASTGNLPRGLYRAVLYNKGGESSQRTFTFDGVVRFPFPELIIVNNTYSVRSAWPVNRLVYYDSNGDFIRSAELESLSGSLSQADLPSNAITAALWAEDEANFCSAFTNAVPVN